MRICQTLWVLEGPLLLLIEHLSGYDVALLVHAVLMVGEKITGRRGEIYGSLGIVVASALAVNPLLLITHTLLTAISGIVEYSVYRLIRYLITKLHIKKEH